MHLTSGLLLCVGATISDQSEEGSLLSRQHHGKPIVHHLQSLHTSQYWGDHTCSLPFPPDALPLVSDLIPLASALSSLASAPSPLSHHSHTSVPTPLPPDNCSLTPYSCPSLLTLLPYTMSLLPHPLPLLPCPLITALLSLNPSPHQPLTTHIFPLLPHPLPSSLAP